jgi:hypothetical protein
MTPTRSPQPASNQQAQAQEGSPRRAQEVIERERSRGIIEHSPYTPRLNDARTPESGSFKQSP